MTTSQLAVAIERFVAVAKERGSPDANAPLQYEAFTSTRTLMTAAARCYPGEHRLTAPDEARQGFRSEHCMLALGAIRVIHQAIEGRCIAETTFDSRYLAVHYLVRGRGVVSVGGEVVADLRPGEFMFQINRSPIVRTEMSDGYAAISVHIPIPEGRRFSLRGEGATAERPNPPLKNGLITTAQASFWESHLAYAISHALDSLASGVAAEADDRLLGEYLYLLCSHELARRSQCRDGSNGPAIVPLKLRTAEQYAKMHAAQAPTVEQLAAEAGVSARNLHDLFMRFRGMPPSDFIREERLRGIRQALLRARSGATVSGIAAGWGYQNFGNFAALYRKRFGELPSETLDRREARVATRM